jgi:hypothetical protein
MDQAAEILERQQVSTATAMDLVNAALDQLTYVHSALRQESAEGEIDSGQSSGATPTGKEVNLDARIAQLRLLRDMQLAINQQTIALNADTPAAELPERNSQVNTLEHRDAIQPSSPRHRVDELAARQGKLAELVLGLMKAGQGSEDERLPQESSDAPPALEELDRELNLLLP